MSALIEALQLVTGLLLFLSVAVTAVALVAVVLLTLAARYIKREIRESNGNEGNTRPGK